MFPFCSSTQSAYFYNEFLSNDPLGYLVSNAIFHNGLMKNELSNLDIDLHMTLATLCISMTKEQKEKLSKFLHIINQLLLQKNCDLFSEKRIPTSYNNICNTYINGTDSILKRPNLIWKSSSHMSEDMGYVTPTVHLVAILPVVT